MSSTSNPVVLESEINEFLRENSGIKIKDIKFGASFFYDQKADGYNGGYAALLMYEEKARHNRSSSL